MSERDDREPVLPDRTSDETDVGWGDRGDGAGEADDVRRLTEDVPPHHVDRD